jgi:hypothetical protein
MTRLEAPTWLSQRAWDLRIIHSTIGWQVNLQPYCVRPSSHPVFDYAEHGDTEALGALMRSGQASIHDIDEDGWSLLHVSAHEFGSVIVTLIRPHSSPVIIAVLKWSSNCYSGELT